MSILIKIILGVILNYPGAFVRWFVFKKYTYDEYLEEITLNYVVTMFLIALIFAIFFITKEVFQ